MPSRNDVLPILCASAATEERAVHAMTRGIRPERYRKILWERLRRMLLRKLRMNCLLTTETGPANALVQMQARYNHCGEAASEKCLSAATFVRPRGKATSLEVQRDDLPAIERPQA